MGGGYYSTQVDCSITSSSESSLALDASATERLQYIYTWLRGKGLTQIQAAAVVGNIAGESGGNPLASQDPKRDISDPMTIPTPEQAKVAAEKNGAVGVGHAWGIIQWDHGARAIYYQKKAGITGSISDMNTQLMLVLWHMKNESPTSSSNMFKDFNQTTIKEAVAYFEDKMEGAGRPNLGKREAAANIALEKYEQAAQTSYLDTKQSNNYVSNTWQSSPTATETNSATDPSMAAATSLASTGCAPSVSAADPSDAGLIALIQKYAWPTPDHKPTSEQTPAYQAAITAAKAAGKYIGGSNGDDCGGFITRLMQDSGRDPNYGGGGNTGVEMIYLKKHTELYRQVPFSEVKFGDIGIFSGHTFMYVGSAVPGFKYPIVEAALRSGEESSAPRNINSLSYNNGHGAIYYRYMGGSNAL